MPENMKETAACDTLSWPLPLCVKDALQHHGTSARLASTGRPTARCPTHLTAHKARADGHQIILGRGRGGVLVAGTTSITAVGLAVAGARCVAFNVLIGARVKEPLCVLPG